MIHILSSYEAEGLDKYVSEWSKEESKIAYGIIQKMAAENIQTESKSYTKKLWSQIILTASACIGVPVILSLLKDAVPNFEMWERYGMGGLSIFTTLQALKIGSTVSEMFKHRRENKELISKYKKRNKH